MTPIEAFKATYKRNREEKAKRPVFFGFFKENLKKSKKTESSKEKRLKK